MYNFFLTVRGYELDSFGHVNNSVYLNYFEQARWEIFHQLGLLDYFTTNNVMLVVTEVQVRYSREVKLFNDLEIKTTVRKESPYLIFEHKMYFKGTSVKACSGKVKSLFTDKQMVKYDIPELFIEKLKLR
jgi:YbgC/YbaW family acyl-CoA thioester hydrolase